MCLGRWSTSWDPEIDLREDLQECVQSSRAEVVCLPRRTPTWSLRTGGEQCVIFPARSLIEPRYLDVLMAVSRASDRIQCRRCRLPGTGHVGECHGLSPGKEAGTNCTSDTATNPRLSSSMRVVVVLLMTIVFTLSN